MLNHLSEDYFSKNDDELSCMRRKILSKTLLLLNSIKLFTVIEGYFLGPGAVMQRVNALT